MSGSAYTRWYRVGAVNVTQGSRVVTGVDTYWLDAGLNPGDIFMTDLQTSYEIETVTDSTHITLRDAYQGATASNKDYKIIRNFTATLPADIAAKTAQLLGDFRRYVDTDMQSIQGKSAYDIACEHGFSGTEAQWLDSLQGDGSRIAEIEADIGALTSLSTSAKGSVVAAINEVNSGKKANTSSIGTLSSLGTSAKGTIVAAINEVNSGKNNNTSSINTLTSNIGTLSNLGTSSKANIVSAINEVNSGKTTNATNISTLTTAVGTLSSLGTSAKTNLVAAINEVNTGKKTNATNITTLTTSLGTLSSLGTSAKTNLVAAINEVNTAKNTLNTSVGTLSSLNTSAKGNLVAAINEVNTAGKTNATNITTLQSDVSGIFNLHKATGTGFKNSVYRAVNLGSSVTSDQWAEIKAASFKGLWVGAYWDIAVPAYSWTDTSGTVHNESAPGTLRFRIAAFNYGLHFRGGSYNNQNHVLVLSEKVLYTAKMNDTATTEGGFVGSAMYKNNLKRAQAIFEAAFGAAHLYGHSDFLSNAVTDGEVSGNAWVTVKVGLLTEAMLTGSYSHSLSNRLCSMGSTLLPLFSFLPSARCGYNLSGGNAGYWTNTPYNESAWVAWFATDHIDGAKANVTDEGVRPYALLYQA